MGDHPPSRSRAIGSTVMRFHAGYLWGKPVMRAFGALCVLLLGSLIVTSGLLESSQRLSAIRLTNPSGYAEDGWRIVRFASALLFGIHGALTHVPSAMSYRCFVAGNGIRMTTFWWGRRWTEGLLLSGAFLAFQSLYLLIGLVACRTLPDLDMLLWRMGYAWLFAMQIGTYAALVSSITRSPVGSIPGFLMAALTIESRLLSEVQGDVYLTWMHSLVAAEVWTSFGTVTSANLTTNWLALCLVNGMLFWFDRRKDGETSQNVV